MNLNEELQDFRKDFLLKHNISCSTCVKNRNGKCTSKVPCIVQDKTLNCAYSLRKTTFRKDWKVFFCPRCGKTFTVSDTEYQLAYEEYTTKVKENKDSMQRGGLFLFIPFALKGHSEWIYKTDEDYTEEIKKYESTYSKS